MKAASKRISPCLFVSMLISLTPSVVLAQHKECASQPDVTTFSCSGGSGSPCTKTVTPADPTCTADCPSRCIWCGCTFSNTIVTVTTYSGTVTLTSKAVLDGIPQQDCGGNCEFVDTYDEGEILIFEYNCATCTTAGKGVPSETAGQACTSQETYGG